MDTGQGSWAGREEERGAGDPATASNKHEVEARLRGLRNRHRLAIHVWEHTYPNQFPDYSWEAFNLTAADQIDSKLQSAKVPLISMSLLPSDRPNIAMQTYVMNTDKPSRSSFAYLLDMDQDKPHPPRVARAELIGLNSGIDIHTKSLGLNRDCKIFGLYDYYRQFRTERDAKKYAGGEHARQHTEQQLDKLGQHYEACPESVLPYEKAGQRIVSYNEILATAAKEHIAAIAIPFAASAAMPATYVPEMKLLGAIAGLEHLEEGLDVPLVFYRVTPPFPSAPGPECKQGDCLYLAQGREELMALALDSIRELQRLHPPRTEQYLYTEVISTRVSNVLNLDIYTPLHEQHEAIEKLRRSQIGKVAR